MPSLDGGVWRSCRRSATATCVRPAGGSDLRNAQPIAVEYARGAIAIAHNGNLVNANELRARLEAQGAIFQSSADTEVIIHLIAHSREGDTVDRVVAALRQVKGAYSCVLLTEKKIIAVRDPHGFRPLAMGRLRDSFVFASETCDSTYRAEFIRD